MGAEKINFDELRKAREELNKELGITTEPVKTPKNEESELENSTSENSADEISSSTLDEDAKLSQTDSNLVETESSFDEEIESNDAQDLETEAEKSSEETSNADDAMNDFNDILLALLNDAPEEEVEDKYNVEEIVEELEKADLVDETENTFEEKVEKVDLPLENAEKVVEIAKNDEDLTTLNAKNEQKVENTSKDIEKTEEEDKSSNNFDDFELKPIYIPNIEINSQNDSHTEKPFVEEQTESEKPHEEKEEQPAESNETLAGEEENKAESAEQSLEEKPDENLLKKIDDAKFINLIRTKEFMESDSLTCIYGTDEENNVFCQNFKDFYNTAIFSDNDENVFDLFSSVIMSLLLKNTKFDVKFAICDAKIGGKFNIYNSLSYMFFDRIAESNREIIEALKEISLEIDSRYKSLAKAGTNSIEKFNAEMKKAKIAPLPYLVLFFNNYSRAYHLDDSNEINTQLSYILRFGRLVGVYAYVVSFDENLAENINYNLQTRIAYKVDLKDTSITELGEEGAELINANDEFIVKTLYSDKLIHLKAPKISQKEIELLIKNIEKK